MALKTDNQNVAAEFKKMAKAVYGVGYQTKAAADLGYAFRTVHRWVKGEYPPPPEIMADLRNRLSTTNTCVDVILDDFNGLVDKAREAGWSEAEISDTVKALAERLVR